MSPEAVDVNALYERGGHAVSVLEVVASAVREDGDDMLDRCAAASSVALAKSELYEIAAHLEGNSDTNHEIIQTLGIVELVEHVLQGEPDSNRGTHIACTLRLATGALSEGLGTMLTEALKEDVASPTEVAP